MNSTQTPIFQVHGNSSVHQVKHALSDESQDPKNSSQSSSDVEDNFYCLGCGIALGVNNPRQYCGKTECKAQIHDN